MLAILLTGCDSTAPAALKSCRLGNLCVAVAAGRLNIMELSRSVAQIASHLSGK